MTSREIRRDAFLADHILGIGRDVIRIGRDVTITTSQPFMIRSRSIIITLRPNYILVAM